MVLSAAQKRQKRAVRAMFDSLGVAALVATIGCGQAQAPKPAETAPPPPADSGLRAYVSDETGGNVVIVDPEVGKVVSTIAVGKRPRGLRLSPDGKVLYVALSGSPIAGPGVDESKLPPPDRAADGIGVVDLASGKVIKTLDSGPDPESFDISPDGKMLYASNEDAATLTVLDLESGKILAKVKVEEEPEGVQVSPDGAEVYVTCEGGSSVFAIDTKTHKVLGRMKTAERPRGIAFSADGKVAYVSAENGSAVAVIDTAARKVTHTIAIAKTDAMPVPPKPMGVVLTPDGKELLVALGRAKAIAGIDTATHAVTRTLEDVGTRIWGISLSKDGKKLYTANGSSGDISVVDIATGKIDRKISVGGSPWGFAVAK